MRRHLQIILLIAVIIQIGTHQAYAQNERLELTLPKRNLEEGETIELRLVCHNMSQPSVPAAVVPEQLDLKLLNKTPSRNITIINGRSSSKFTYALQLTARKQGACVLGPITVTADGKEYSTGTYNINVTKTDMSKDARGDRLVFAEIEAPRKSVFVTQTVNAKLTIGIREVRINGRRYELNMLRDVLDVRRSQLSVFENGTADQSTMIILDSNGKRNRYVVYTVEMPIRAEEVGTLDIGPIFIKANYPTAMRRGFFGYEIRSSKPEFTRTEAISIEVNAPPADGRPASYAGALGKFRMNVDAKPTEVEQGKPVTLTITITGTPIDGIAGPDLATNAELASRFEFTTDELIGDVQGNRKVFRRAVFPRESGEQLIPPIAWSYFDAATRKYVTLASDPIRLNVKPASDTAAAFSLSENNESDRNTELTVLTGGISPNYVDVDQLLQSQTLALSPPLLAGLGAVPAVYVAVAMLTWRRKRLRNDRGLARRRAAMRNADILLRRAQNERQQAEQWTALADAMKGYLADRFNLPPGEITPVESRDLLRSCGAHEIADEVGLFLESCNEVAYAPSDDNHHAAEEAEARIRKWIRNIEKAAK